MYQVCKLKVTEETYKTPLITPPLPASENKQDEIRDLVDKETQEVTTSEAATSEPKVVQIEFHKTNVRFIK